MRLVEYAIYIAPLVGFLTLLVGVAAVFWPEAMSKKFGVAAHGAALAYVISTGVRDVCIGLIVLTLYHQREYSILGVAFLALGIVAGSDFLVVRKSGDRKTSWTHLIGGVAVVGYGIWLMGQLSNQ